MFQALSTSDSVCLSLKCTAAEKAFKVPPTSTKYDYASHSTVTAIKFHIRKTERGMGDLKVRDTHTSNGTQANKAAEST